VRLPGELEGLAALVIPGGESTTMGLLAREYGLVDALRSFGRTHPVWGTCAGAILLSGGRGGSPESDDPLRLGLMAMEARRNAMGRQVESFQVDLRVPVLDGLGQGQAPFPSIFIRAPLLYPLDIGRVELLATLDDGGIVAAREGHHLATSFHPELTEDDRFHRYFLKLVQS
jgi:5'-phosphate synthase pdxT subunit